MSKVELRCGDAVEIMSTIANNSIDLIMTDPPYPKEFEHLYTEMAREAGRILRIGGSLVTLCGHHQLARILPAMTQYLKYRWIIKLDHNGHHARMRMGIMVTWKPMLWFVNQKLSPRRNVIDTAESRGRSKINHPWEQSIDYALWGIENLTDDYDTVLDPFMGSGTTGIVCVSLGRNFIGIDIDQRYVDVAARRIAEAQAQPVMEFAK